MSTFDKVTDVAVEEFAKQNPHSAFDPAIIFVLADIIAQIIEALQKCKQTPAEAVAIANKPSLLQKFVVRRAVQKTLGFREFREHGEAVIAALHATGRRVELSDVEELLDS